MQPDLNLLLTALRDQPTDRRLDQLEPSIWARIAALRRQPMHTSVWGWRAALAAAMVAMGVFAGGAATARAASEPSPFAIHSDLAPSTLLDGRS